MRAACRKQQQQQQSPPPRIRTSSSSSSTAAACLVTTLLSGGSRSAMALSLSAYTSRSRTMTSPGFVPALAARMSSSFLNKRHSSTYSEEKRSSSLGPVGGWRNRRGLSMSGGGWGRNR
ncbi:unnamed protein product, partial [Pylaiella littoralis]